MGNCFSDLSNDESKWPFVGREKDIEKANELLQKNGSVLVYGMKKIGKSRFLEKLQGYVRASENFEGYKVLFKDFEYDDVNSSNDQFDWCKDILDSFGAEREIKSLEKMFSDYKRIPCHSCQLCKSVDGRCEKQDELLESAINILIKHLKKSKQKIVLFLDNVDKLMSSPLKDHFLTFHRKSLQCPTFKTVITSSNKPKQTTKNYGTLEVKPLEHNDNLKLLFLTTEERDNNTDVQKPVVVKFAPEHKIFKDENRRFLEVIVRLCEGLPLAAVMSGLLLTEDEGLLTPADLVEILICIRLRSLSPDNCPPDDRLAIYERSMEEVSEFGEFFNCLNENMTGESLTVNEAVEATGGKETAARVKFHILKKGLDRSVLSIEQMSGEQKIQWHGILRECQAALKAIDDVPSGGESAKNMVLKFMKENVRRACLDFDEEILSDPKKLEQAIKCLSLKSPEPKSPNHDERPAKYEGEYDTETSPVVQASEGDGFDKDFQTPTDTGNKHKFKLQTRYSSTEDNDNEENGINLEFTNSVRVNIGSPYSSQNELPNTTPYDAYHSTAPPPYTSVPDSQGTEEQRYNQSDARRKIFKQMNYQHNIPVSGEPPPSYSSHYSNMQSIQSHSMPSVYYPPSLQERNENDSQCNKRQPDGLNLRRVHSDPVGTNVKGSLAVRSDFISRPESDRSVNESLNGPPALLYIPPSIPMESERQHIFPLSGEQRGAESRGLSLRMSELKENVSDLSVLPVDQSDFVNRQAQPNYIECSTYGPSAFGLQLREQLHSVHNNSSFMVQTRSVNVSVNSSAGPSRNQQDRDNAEKSSSLNSFGKTSETKTKVPKAPVAVVNPLR